MQICVHPGKRYLMWEDGSPYYPIADTAWTLPQRLTEEDVVYYADCRKAQGFNTVLICAFSELDGIRDPNRYGEFPFIDGDPLKPDEAYWVRLDRFLRVFWERDMVVGLLPTWGDKFNRKQGDGPEIFTPANAPVYTQWLAERYLGQDRLFWVLGGDRPLETETHRQIIRGMAAGLRRGGSKHLITFHPCGATSSLDFLPQEDWLDFHSQQSGHGIECWDSATMLKKAREAEEKPCWDMESRYEDFPACFDEALGYCWSAADARWNIYQNMLSGAAGQAYGHRYIWCFEENEKASWRSALHAQAASQQAIAARLRCRGDFFNFVPMPEMLFQNREGMGKLAAAAGKNYALVYTPLGGEICVDFRKLTDRRLRCSWFDPRTGEERLFSVLSSQKHVVCPPTNGQDWILIAEW